MIRNIAKYIIIATLALPMASCNEWLGEDSPGVSDFDDFFSVPEVAQQTVNACYAPLAWEFNKTYFSEWFFGDIASDDALKGGQNLADGADAYDIDNFKVNANNGICLDYYRAKYQGIARCNLVLQEIPKMALDEKVLTEKFRDRLLGEAYFLRGLYYFQLVRVFGGVPLVDFVIDSSNKWQQPRATVQQVYEHIVSDLTQAESLLWNKSDYAAEDLGRATKGAAQGMLCKVYLYMKDYDNAYKWGKTWVDQQYRTGQYSLCRNYYDNFTLAGENGPESVFEIQYMADPTSDYGEGFGFTRGTFTTVMCRPRLTQLGQTGWGWNHPTQNLYDEFEAGDPRREYTIGVPTDEERSEAEVNYLGSPYWNYKVAYVENGTLPRLDHDSRSPLNYRVMRASDVLLLYAEAALESGKDVAAAKWALEEVRARARANQANADVLPAFPDYRGYKDNNDDLRAALRHERRVELAMEGHRWFDLVRWGIAYDVLDRDKGSYGANESQEARKEMANFIPGKSELFPIPAEEINLNPMDQNPGY